MRLYNYFPIFVRFFSYFKTIIATTEYSDDAHALACVSLKLYFLPKRLRVGVGGTELAGVMQRGVNILGYSEASLLYNADCSESRCFSCLSIEEPNKIAASLRGSPIFL